MNAVNYDMYLWNGKFVALVPDIFEYNEFTDNNIRMLPVQWLGLPLRYIHMVYFSTVY